MTKPVIVTEAEDPDWHYIDLFRVIRPAKTDASKARAASEYVASEIARHREAAFQAGIEAAAKCAEDCAPDGYMSDREREYCRDHGGDIAIAIRALGSGE